MCSVKRSERVYLKAFKSLKRAYPTYEQLRQASVKELSARVSWGGLQNLKSRLVNKILATITEKFRKPTLAPLRNMPEDECEKFLCSLPGVGKKVARCVMLYSLNKEVFPVDTNCWRISKRLGLVNFSSGKNSCTAKDMDMIQQVIPPKIRLPLHVNMLSLGRDVCIARQPKCNSCVIAVYCSKISVQPKNL